MKHITIIFKTTLIAVTSSSIITGLIGWKNSHYGFVFMFIMIVANILLPSLCGILLFHLLFNFLSKHFASLNRLVGKLLLSAATTVLFAVLFIGVDIALHGLGENMLLEYRGWLPVTLITCVVVPIVYHRFLFKQPQ